MATVTQPLLTAEEFARRADPGYPEELVKGRIVTGPTPGLRHGQVCAQIVFLLKLAVEDRELGRVLSNDSGVVTERGPDSVRGPDVSFYSYAKVPKGSAPEGYAAVPPDVVFEVLSPHDRWPLVLGKVAEYLNAGVAAVVVVDPARGVVHTYEGDEPVRISGDADELALAGPLAGLRLAVGQILG
jgi:Uma2 family endonuclease